MNRNFGSCLQRIDPDTGKAIWEHERLVSSEAIGVDAIAVDRAAFYLVTHNVLSAYARDDGHRIWERSLAGPEGNWRVTLHRGQLIVYPLQSPALEFRVRGPFGSLECILASSVVQPSEQSFPVIFADPKTGRLDQRMNFTAPDSRARLTARFNPVAAAEPEVGLQMTSPLLPPQVRFTAATAAVVLPERLWRLKANQRDKPAAP
jgi:hypothetical protein